MEKETTKFHALQLFTDTISAETVHLTNEAVGIYNRLLWFHWTKNTKPFTTESAYRICQCKTKECETKVLKVLNEFFIRDNVIKNHDSKTQSWINKRAVKEHKYLTEKYRAKSDAGKKGMESRYNSVNNKTITPIPNPNPIPNKQLKVAFEEFWNLLYYKKGSKHLAYKRYIVHCSKAVPSDIANMYNKYTSTVKDKEFQAHVATWINQRRFEDEENNKPKEIKEPIYEYKGIKLKKIGQFGEFIELKDDKGNRYQKHKFKSIPIEKV